MTRILVQRGSAGGSSSSNPNRSSAVAGPSSSTSAPAAQPQVNLPLVASAGKDEEIVGDLQEQVVVDDFVEYFGSGDIKAARSDDLSQESSHDVYKDDDEINDSEKVRIEDDDLTSGLGELQIMGNETEGSSGGSLQRVCGSSCPPPPPVPPPKPSSGNSSSRRFVTLGSSNSPRIGSSRRASAWPIVSTRTSPTGSRPSSPRSHCEAEGYNSADEQSPCFGSCYDDAERERQFEIDIRRAKGLEVKRMMEDGNCLFRAVADQVYGDSEGYDLVRQMCIDYMERERDHFSQFITEGFMSYCKRKRRDKVYGNNVEIQALAEMYNRPIHIYSYGTDCMNAEPINIFHGSYDTDTPPIRLSYHHGNHYNSLVDPRRLAIGAGLGFSSLRGRNVDTDQVKAAIKAQQDQQIDNALLAEGRFFSDLELTEKEIERMVMEASRAEYLSDDKFKQQLGCQESSTSGAEPSSSGARSSGSDTKAGALADAVLSSSMQIVLSMGFSYLQVIEAYSIFGDDVDSMVCYLLETGNSSRRKGKATE
ncbi:OVARIAN TUMOR DOMAIN-containing deubiquitinating enzyme 6 isoform X3 [Rhododendron vialii]|uniref:OVARIAN TUMOR DOMAIN-containing deubiquitinating enzyme 6 isoform X3 n=1 Tax=Rhododendron vialii TaxID=182163 RepID=UPI00265EA77E|nr:OVARIAN TUMOR DOMAIN-containing deubiquitinating enzyme 6 isoform X3 [Rhododendron vialii]